MILDGFVSLFNTKSVPESTNGLQSSETSSMYLAHIATRQQCFYFTDQATPLERKVMGDNSSESICQLERNASRRRGCEEREYVNAQSFAF